MSVINQVKTENNGLFEALSTVVDIDSKRMIKRLCKHFSHKIKAEWNEHHGYLEFAMGSCEMIDKNGQLNFRCLADSKTELNEIVDCIERHFLRFLNRNECSLEWDVINLSGKQNA